MIQLPDILKIRSSASDPFTTVLAIKGDKGDTGALCTVLGRYDTLADLEAGASNPNAGDAYAVGTEAPYHIYIYDGVNSEWADFGTAIQGPMGPRGVRGPAGERGSAGFSPLITIQATTDGADITVQDQTGTRSAHISNGHQGDPGPVGPYFTPLVSGAGELSWSNNGGLVNPPPVSIKGPAGSSPERGVDYWTNADKAEIVSAASASVTPSTIGAIADPEEKSNGQFLQYVVPEGSSAGSWVASSSAGGVVSVNGDTGAVSTRLIFENVAVDPEDFVLMQNPTYDIFPYYAALSCIGVGTDMIPDVFFAYDQRITGNFSADSETATNCVYIFASVPPEESFTIPLIICWK